MSIPLLIFTTILVVVGALSEDAFYKCSESTPVVSDDGFSLKQPLEGGLPFYGGVYHDYYVGTNGIVQFAREPSTEKTIIGTFPDTRYTFIAPFYGDLKLDDTDSHANFCIVNNNDIEMQNFVSCTDFMPQLSIVATWSEIGYNSDDSPANTFQCVIQTDGKKTFVIFLYKKLQWTARNPVHVGFNNGTNRAFWKMPCSGTEDIVSLVNTSNVECDGLWVFRVDGETIEPACTNKETCNNDELCSCLQDCRGKNCLCKEAVNTCSKGDMEDDCTMSIPLATPTANTPGGVGPTNECKSSTMAIVGISVILGLVSIISITINIIALSYIKFCKKKT